MSARPFAAGVGAAAMGAAALLVCGGAMAGPMDVRGPDGTRWKINDDNEPSLLERRLPGNKLDPAFGQNGRLLLDIVGTEANIDALRVDTTGRIWLGATSLASTSTSPMVLRLQANGQPDTSWGAAGRSSANPVGQRLMVVDLLPAADGSAWVTGTLYGSQGENDAGLWHLKANGTLDYGFGSGGIWRRTGNERSRPLSLAAGPDGVIALGIDVLTGSKPGREIYVIRPNERQPRLEVASETAESDEDEDGYLLWGGQRWIWRNGQQSAELSGLPVLAMGEAMASAPDNPQGEVGHAGLNPFTVLDNTPAPPPPPPPADELPWGWLIAGLGGLIALLAFWWRGRT